MHRDGEMSHPPVFDPDFEEEVEPNESQTAETDIIAIHEEYNTKPLAKNAKSYELEKFERNAMIIFNYENIEGYEERVGTNFDVAALADTFSNFGFEIEVYNDYTKVELFTKLKKFSEKNFTDYGCVAVVILTHGTEYGLLRARDGELFSEQDIINHFKVHSKPTLYTKPIVLMIQACRGKSSTRGVMTMQIQRARINRDHDQEMEAYYLPVESDMLIFHSSFAGKPSFRPDNGSWFIQTLCKQIKKLYRKHHLESIFHEVKREVALEKYYMERNPSTGEIEVNKQMPVVTSTLIRKLYLRSFKDSPLTRIAFNNETNVDGQDSTANRSGSIIESCYCYLDHFDYMKRCLSHLIKNTQKNDKVAKYLLNMAEMQSGSDEKTKTTLAAISNYLQTHYEKSEYYNYIYFYEGDCELDSAELKIDQCKDNTNIVRSLTKTWSKWSQSNTARTLGLCLGVSLMYISFSRRL